MFAWLLTRSSISNALGEPRPREELSCARDRLSNQEFLSAVSPDIQAPVRRWQRPQVFFVTVARLTAACASILKARR